MAKECRLYDFRKAGRIEESAGRYLRTWLTRTSASLQQRWSEICKTPITVAPEPLFAQAFSGFQEGCDPVSFGATMQLELGQPGTGSLQSQLLVSQVDMLALVLELLSEDLESKPELRELTSIELNLSELLMEQLSASLAESWLQKEQLQYKSGQLDRNPQRCRLFAPSEPVIVAGLSVQAKGGKSLFQWVLPRAGLTAAVKELLGEPQRKEPPKPANLRSLLSEIPVDLVVKLGGTSVGMDELRELRPGTIIVFDQAIGSPLTAFLEDQPLFLGWPGRQGTKQAFQVAEIP